MRKDFYAVLSVPRDTKAPQIKRRFIELARERHPDRFEGDEKERAELEFQSITEAFNILMNPELRRQHDMELDIPAPGSVQNPKQVARVYLNRGIRAYNKGRLGEAADNFERATRAEPHNYQTWHHLALACSKETRWLEKARRAIERACDLRPGHAPYFKLAGKIFALSKKTATAKQYYNQALELGGVDPAVHKALKALGDPAHGGADRGGTQRERGSADGKTRQEQRKTGLFKRVW